MITPELLYMLACPKCQTGALRPTAYTADTGAPTDELRCDGCETHFPIHSGFPILIPQDALTGAEWVEWQKHLDKFQARRMARVQSPDDTVNRLADRSQPQPSFARFTGIEEGAVLDIGCGPGKFRRHFDRKRVTYVGLDPIDLPEASTFPFVQGVAEYLPFQSDSFTDVVVLAALDHFRDLDRFLGEARRVLGPKGRLHILQSVHEVRGPVSAVKVLAHKLKDSLEDRRTTGHDRTVPKHLGEYTSRSLIDRFAGEFELLSVERYSAAWYSPVKLFLSFAPRAAAMGAVRSA